MKFFIDEIIENEELKAILLDSNNAELVSRGRQIADEIIRADRYVPMEEGIIRIFVMAHLADHTLKINSARGIPRDITVATLKDVNLWVENYIAVHEIPGLSNLSWLTDHCLGRLFRLGRLQFVLGPSPAEIPQGDYVINTHIPQGEPLDIDACMESFRQAGEFFPKFFPDRPAMYFDCDSWLLSPNLPAIADKDSNIYRFMQLWTLVPEKLGGHSQALSRVFGFAFNHDDPASAPEKTSLQRRLKAYTLAGGKVPCGYGYRKI